MSTHAPLVHSVHFYDFDGELISRLSGIVTSSLSTDNATLVVASDAHRRQLGAILTERFPGWKAALADGRLVMLDAKETLDKFMVDGMPDRRMFQETVGKLVISTRNAAKSANRGLTVFGEMVAVLWAEGNTAAALELEMLWNELLFDRSFHLHCAYPKSVFGAGADSMAMSAVCDRHSHVINDDAVN